MKYPIENKILDFSKARQLWKPGDAVLAAVSGGPDSLGLLCFLARIREKEHIKLGCCVVNHHLRPEAAKEALHVKKIADQLHVPCWIKDIYVNEYRKKQGSSLETAARKLRYQALYEVMKAGGFDLLAVAHHMDDQAETVLYHLIRGSGTSGLSGMQPKRGAVIRPLLCVRKKELESYLTELGIAACHDKTNDIPDGARNQIRLLLLPELKKMNPRITESLCRTADILQADEAWMEEEAKKFLSSCSSSRLGVLFADRSQWIQKGPAFSRFLIHLILNQWREKSEDVDFDGIERIRCLIWSGKNGAYTSLGGMIFWLADPCVVIFPGNSREPLPSDKLAQAYFYYSLHDSIAFKPAFIQRKEPLDKEEAAFPWNITVEKLGKKPGRTAKNQFILPAEGAGKLQVRYPKPSDRFYPRGLDQDVSLIKYMQSLKIPGALRRKWPVLADENRVYWVPPFRGAALNALKAEESEYLLVTITCNVKKNKEETK